MSRSRAVQSPRADEINEVNKRVWDQDKLGDIRRSRERRKGKDEKKKRSKVDIIASCFPWKTYAAQSGPLKGHASGVSGEMISDQIR